MGPEEKPDAVSRLEEELACCRRELAQKERENTELKRKLSHLQEDFDHFRARMDQEKASLLEKIQDQEILDFLVIFEELERAFQVFDQDSDFAGLVEGIKFILEHFAAILRRKGCCRMEAVGEPFDPTYHEAVAAVPSTVAANVVIEEYMRGWLRGGRVLRPAKVKVSLGPEGGEGDARGPREGCRN